MMTTGSHCKVSKTNQNRKKDVKAEDINMMIQKEYDKELIDIGLQLIHLEMLLQKEKHRFGWIMNKNKVRWNSL